jgi:hypothetical protein
MSMKRFLFIFALVASFALSAAPVAMAQDEVDIEAVAETVLAADLDTLLADMETPMADDALPAGFSGATFMEPGEAGSEMGAIPADDLEGSEGSIAYMLDYAPGGAEGTPAAGAMSFGFASVNYVFVDEEITEDDLKDFREGAEEGVASEEEGTATVEEIEVNGTDAVLLTFLLEEDGVTSVVKMVAVPVGNTMVMAMVAEAASEVDEDAVYAAAEELTFASIAHLGETAEGAN